MGLPVWAIYAIMAASIVYQVSEARKAKKRAQEAADAAKGREISVEGESYALPLIYGRSTVAGGRVYHNTSSAYYHSAPAAGGIAFQSNMESSREGTKNEYLYIQQALCRGPINRAVNWKVDDQESETEELKFGQRLHVYPSGGVADPMMVANFSERSTAVFTDTAYASMVFRLNRDEPQYNGVPNVSFYIEGKLVRPVVKTGDVYSLGSYVYSNNPAYCLLDYLMDSKYGRGLSTSDIDLKSFYNAAQICATIVQSNVKIEGKIWEGNTLRNLPLYECNLFLDTEKSVRDNVIEILATMGDADLVWSAGKYKLQLQYPSGLGSVVLAGTLGDDDIVRETISVKYPSAAERLNHCTVRFKDEAQNFKDNTASWPKKGSSVHTALLQQDNNVPLENSTTEAGITDIYHALAKAEELVRVSRSSVQYQFKVNLKNTFFEPGDIIFVNTSINVLKNEYLKINEIKVDSNGVADLTATKFDPNQLAWNAKNDQVVPQRNNYNFSLLPPSDIVFEANPADSLTGGIGRLSWTKPSGIEPALYLIEYKLTSETVYKTLGTSASNSIEIFSLVTGTYNFAVRSKSTLGLTSARVYSSQIAIDDGTSTPPSFSLSDSVVLTAGKVTTNLYVTMITPDVGAFIAGYEVEAKLQSDSVWTSLGRSASKTFELTNVKDGFNYDVRARVVNKAGKFSEYRTGSKNIIGKLAAPSNVSNFNASLNTDGILLKWDRITDLDADSYEIRTGASWSAGTTVAVTKDNRFQINRPSSGLKSYFVKAKDTSGIYSLQDSFTSIEVGAPSAPVVTGSISDTQYVLSWTVPSSSIEVSEYIIRSNGTVIARIDSTKFSATAVWSGSKIFTVAAIDIAGNEGPASQTEIEISSPPATSITSQVIDNNVLLRWSRAKGTLPLLGYELRKGATWATGSVVGLLSSEFTVVFESFAGTYTYWIAAKDVANNYGPERSISTLVNQPPDFVLATDYSTTFNTPTSVKTNAVPDADEGLVLPFDTARTWNSQFTGNGWTSIQSAIDAGMQYYIQPAVSSGYYEEVFDYGSILESMKVSIVPTYNIVSGNPNITIDISISANGTTWIDYPGSSEIFGVNFRYVKFRVSVSATANTDVVHLSNLKLILSAKLKTDTNSVYANASDVGGTTVTFKEQFLDVTSIVVSAKGTTAAYALYDFTDVPNPTSFKVLLFNTSGNRVSGDVSWTAQGY